MPVPAEAEKTDEVGATELPKLRQGPRMSAVASLGPPKANTTLADRWNRLGPPLSHSIVMPTQSTLLVAF